MCLYYSLRDHLKNFSFFQPFHSIHSNILGSTSHDNCSMVSNSIWAFLFLFNSYFYLSLVLSSSLNIFIFACQVKQHYWPIYETFRCLAHIIYKLPLPSVSPFLGRLWSRQSLAWWFATVWIFGLVNSYQLLLMGWLTLRHTRFFFSIHFRAHISDLTWCKLEAVSSFL